MDELDELAASLREEARAGRQRRLLVLHGERAAGCQALRGALDAAGIDPEESLLVGPEPIDGLGLERVPRERSTEVLGTTHTCLVLDAHEAFDPNALARTVGAVDGGGLYVLLVPSLDDWPRERDGFDAALAVPPFDIDDVAGRFRARLVDTLREHPGVAIVNVDEPRVERDGLAGVEAETREAEPGEPGLPDRRVFPSEVYEACRTRDQVETVHALESLLDPGQIVVVEADRGRGKSSAAGLAAGGLLERGAEVVVTAPRRSNVDEVFARAEETAEALELAPRRSGEGQALETTGGGLSYRPPLEALASRGEADAIVVDEAAGLPVHVLAGFLEGRTPLAFTTTIHGYEGAGRGFSVRLRDELATSPRPVHRLTMEEPIRYARRDPVEAWSFEALMLDAAPATGDELPAGGPEQARYRQPSGAHLVEDERLLREVFGLLVLAHYRTTPGDLARLLDAPNVSVHALALEGRVVSVALVAREGGLDERLRARMYEGQRVPGNLIPDVLTSQLRDEAAGRTQGWRVLRIATHPDRRREGFASRLLEAIGREAEGEADWLGTSYGATPGLLSFWHEHGYRTVHLSARRNEASGEHSALQLSPLTAEGRELADRSEAWLLRRLPGVLADALDDLDPDVVRSTLGGLERRPELDLGDREWRLVAAAAYGPGVYDTAPRPFRRLALRHLVDGEAELDERAERLLVRKVLQAREWEEVRDELGYESKRMAMRGLGDAFEPLVDAYGGEAAHAERDRYR